MAFKRYLAFTLSLLLACQPAVAGLVAGSAVSGDAVDVAFEAMQAANAEDAAALLEAAKQRLEKDGLAEEDLIQISILLDRALAHARSQNHSQSFGDTIRPLAKEGDGTFVLGRLPMRAVDRLVDSNPDLRTALWQIGQGRIDRSTQFAPGAGLPPASNPNSPTGRTWVPPVGTYPAGYNGPNQNTDPNSLLFKLRQMAQLQDIKLKNQALKDRYPNLTLDDLADKIIRETWIFTFTTSLAASVISDVSKTIAIPLEQVPSIIGGTIIVVRLADLYGIEVDDMAVEAILMSVYHIVKTAGLLKGSLLTPGFVSRISETSVKVMEQLRNTDTNGRRGMVQAARAQVSRMFKRKSHKTGNKGNDDPTAPSGEKASTANEAGNATNDSTVAGDTRTQGRGSEQAGSKEIQPERDKKADTNKPDGGPRGSGRTGKVLAALGVGLQYLPRAVRPFEIYAIGHGAKWWFKRIRALENELKTSSFINFLTSHKGEAFIKLMISSLYVGQPEVPKIDLDHPFEPKVRFILNIHRIARVCSPADMRRWTEINALPPGTAQDSPPRRIKARRGERRGEMNNGQDLNRDEPDPVSSADLSGSEAEKIRLANLSFERKLLRHACDTNLSQARYDRMALEFKTFNKISPDLSALKSAPEVARVKMGELLLQLFYLDGDYGSDGESKYFYEVASTILGFDERQLSYFDTIDSFIRKNGGMIEDFQSPSGYRVANKSVEIPYDLGLGFAPSIDHDMPTRSP